MSSYHDLKSFQQAEVIFDFTVEFCRKYIDKKSRTVDQMEQAARSGKQNIAEGCKGGQTNPKNEIFLLGVARGSLEELLEDYRDFLRQRGLGVWGKDDARARGLRRLAYKSNRSDRSNRADRAGWQAMAGGGRATHVTNPADDKTHTSYTTYQTYLSDPEPAANVMITLINQTNYLLDQQIKAVEQQLTDKGINRESHQQKVARIMSERKKKDEKFDEWIKGILEKKKD